MAEKEAHVFILDVGESMSECNNGRVDSNLDWSMRYFWDKISEIVSLSRKTLCVGVIGLRTDETNNLMEDDDGYNNISVLRDLSGSMDLAGMKALQDAIKPSNQEMGDAISAIAIAINMILDFTKKLKYKRKITLITDGLGRIDMDDEDLKAIADQLNASGISLTVLGVDFDDADYGFKEEDKPQVKRDSEAVLRRLVDKCDETLGSAFGTIAEAIDELDIPVLKATRAFKSYEGKLTLGKPNMYPAAVAIDVERYFHTKTATAPSASTVTIKGGGDGGGRGGVGGTTQTTSQTLDENGNEMEGIEFSGVRQVRTYKVNDPTAPGGKRDVEFDSLARGYEYGRTVVPIMDDEKDEVLLGATSVFTILGFVDQAKYEPMLNMGDTCVVYAAKYNYKSQIAFSSLVQALHKEKLFAVARIVAKNGQQPLLVLLTPDIENSCLHDIPLPFAEDVRGYQFPPLDKVVTVTGATVTQHRLLPGDDLNRAMSDYVDAMDLSTFQTDENGYVSYARPEKNAVEYMAIDEPFSPAIHRIKHAVKERAIHPDKPLPEVPSILTKFSVPPAELVEQAQQKIDALVEVAEVKKVPPKAKGKFHKEKVKPVSGLDLDAILGPAPKLATISPENAIPEFKRMLEAAEAEGEAVDDALVRDAARQMGDIVRNLIASSFGGSRDERALEHLGCMRDGLLALGEPNVYNNFVRGLKRRMLAGELDGDRRELWWKMRKAKLGLIDEFQSAESKVTADEAWEFYSAR